MPPKKLLRNTPKGRKIRPRFREVAQAYRKLSKKLTQAELAVNWLLGFKTGFLGGDDAKAGMGGDEPKAGMGARELRRLRGSPKGKKVRTGFKDAGRTFRGLKQDLVRSENAVNALLGFPKGFLGGDDPKAGLQ